MVRFVVGVLMVRALQGVVSNPRLSPREKRGGLAFKVCHCEPSAAISGLVVEL